MLDYVVNLLILSTVYGILAISLNFLIGSTGIFSMAQAAIFGIGAYTSALVSIHLGWGFIPAVFAAAVMAMLASAVVAIPSLRVSGDYFVVASFALQFIISDVFTNWTHLTSGPAGLPGIPRPGFGPFLLNDPAEYVVLYILFFLGILALTSRIVHSAFGRTLRALREDPVAVQALGKNVVQYKVVAVAVASAIAGVAGSLYAHYITFINPTSFTLDTSILVAAMVILGGVGNVWGGPLGAAVLLLVPEVLRYVDMPDTVAGPLRQLLYGALLIVIIRFRPQGLVGDPKLARDGRASRARSDRATGAEGEVEHA